jgi:hypothetical protein
VSENIGPIFADRRFNHKLDFWEGETAAGDEISIRQMEIEG